MNTSSSFAQSSSTPNFYSPAPPRNSGMKSACRSSTTMLCRSIQSKQFVFMIPDFRQVIPDFRQVRISVTVPPSRKIGTRIFRNRPVPFRKLGMPPGICAQIVACPDGWLLKHGTGRNDRGTFRPVPPTKTFRVRRRPLQPRVRCASVKKRSALLWHGSSQCQPSGSS